MSVATFIPEVWSAALIVPYEKNLVYGQPSVASTAYTGEITKYGDVVHIPSLTAPTVHDYKRGEDITIEDLTANDTELHIDQGKYFAFGVDDVDKVQAAGELINPATAAGAIKLRDNADSYLGTVLRDGALADNKLGTVDVLNDDPAKTTGAAQSGYKLLVRLAEKLNRKSVPTTGRYVVVGAGLYSALLMDPRFSRVDASGNEQGLRNGIVGRAVGFEVLVSNNVPVSKGAELAIAGVPSAFAFASQILETEAVRDTRQFRDIVRGLHVYGSKVIRPEGIATAYVNIVEPGGAPASGASGAEVHTG